MIQQRTHHNINTYSLTWWPQDQSDIATGALLGFQKRMLAVWAVAPPWYVLHLHRVIRGCDSKKHMNGLSDVRKKERTTPLSVNYSFIKEEA